ARSSHTARSAWDRDGGTPRRSWTSTRRWPRRSRRRSTPPSRWGVTWSRRSSRARTRPWPRSNRCWPTRRRESGVPPGPVTPTASRCATVEQALAIAHGLLNRRERTEHEVREQLRRRNGAPEVVEAALRELTEQGYLDDARFARLFAQ